MSVNRRIIQSPSTGMRAVVYPARKGGGDERRVIVYLHGSGGFTAGMTGLYEYPDFPGLLEAGMALDCDALIPVCHRGDRWTSPMIDRFLDDYERRFDGPDHGYDFIGYSRGGLGVYRYGADQPQRMRTGVVVSSRGLDAACERISTVPMFLIHGTEDQLIPATESQRMCDRIVASGGTCILRLLPGDHYIAGAVLADPSVYRWQRTAHGISDAVPGSQ